MFSLVFAQNSWVNEAMVNLNKHKSRFFTWERVGAAVENNSLKDSSQHSDFVDYNASLGDLMRGQRASLGKSLLDVQKELGLAPYIIFAIENGDLEAFPNKSLVGSYVLQYSKYLGWDPQKTYNKFCKESGHVGRINDDSGYTFHITKELSSGKTLKKRISLFEHILGGIIQKSTLTGLAAVSFVSLLLLSGGYLIWTFYFQIYGNPDQITSTATVGTNIFGNDNGSDAINSEDTQIITPNNTTGLPKIGDLILEEVDPSSNFTPNENHDSITSKYTPGNQPKAPSFLPEEDTGLADTPTIDTPDNIDATIENSNDIYLLTTSESWIRVKTESGRVLLERVLVAGEKYEVPNIGERLILRAGNSGSLYFTVGGIGYGPFGSGTSVVDNIYLDYNVLKQNYAMLDVEIDLTGNKFSEEHTSVDSNLANNN